MDIDAPASYEDVNETAVREWTRETTTRERIRAVVQRIRDPTPASTIADRAHASEPVVRETLADLADLGLVETVETGQGTLYKRDDRMAIYRQVVSLQESYDQEELVAELQTLKETVATLRDEYGVETPAELAKKLDPDDTDGWEDHTRWQTARKNLYLAKTAISFNDASTALA